MGDWTYLGPGSDAEFPMLRCGTCRRAKWEPCVPLARPIHNFAVQPQWVWTALEAGKLTSKVVRVEFLRMPGSIARALESLSRWRFEHRKEGVAKFRL